MQKVLLIASLSFLSLCCRKDENPDVTVNLGESRYQFNTVVRTPKISRAVPNAITAGAFDLDISIYDPTQVWPVESMYLFKIPLRTGKHPLKRTTTQLQDGLTGANYYTLSDQGDVLEEVYVLHESAPDNYVELSYYDEKAHEVAGRFNATFVIDPDRGKINPASPDTVRIASGEFYLTLE